MAQPGKGEKTFWMLWVPSSKRRPAVRHYTQVKAEREAARLVKMSGQKAYLFQAVAVIDPPKSELQEGVHRRDLLAPGVDHWFTDQTEITEDLLARLGLVRTPDSTSLLARAVGIAARIFGKPTAGWAGVQDDDVVKLGPINARAGDLKAVQKAAEHV